MTKKNKVLIFIWIIFSISLQAFALEPIELPQPQMTGGKPLMEALKNRQSNRSFRSEELTDQTLSNLLWAAFGVNRPESGKRTAPSAMDEKEIDIYVALEKGLFRYDAERNILEPIVNEDIRGAAGKQDFTQKAPVNLIYVANFDNMSGTDPEKEFYSAIDTGYISQNVYLFCASEGLHTVALAWIDYSTLRQKMQLESLDKRIILSQPVGYPQK